MSPAFWTNGKYFKIKVIVEMKRYVSKYKYFVRFFFLWVPPNMSSSHLKKITTYPLVGTQYLNYPDTFHRMIWLTVPLHLWLCHPYQQLPVKIGWNDKFPIDTPAPVHLHSSFTIFVEIRILLNKICLQIFLDQKLSIGQSFKIKRFWSEKPPDTLLMPISSSPSDGWQA